MEDRERALNAIYKINYKADFINRVLQEALEGAEKKDRAFIANLVYGTIKNQLYIDWIVSKKSKLGFEKLDKYVLCILRLSAYQIFYMDRVPESAICNEAVKLTKKYANSGAAGYVNAVVRNIINDKEELIKPEFNNAVKKISIKYSFPKWIIRLWEEQYGIDKTETLCAALNDEAPLTIRTNLSKITREDLLKTFLQKNIQASEGKYNKEAIIINDTADVTKLEEYKKGYFVIQDESSMLVSNILKPTKHSTVIDMCCAPGGKTTHISALMKDTGEIIAGDISEKKIHTLIEHSKNLGISNIDFRVWDAVKLNRDLIDKADYILADLPCSGLGVIRRKPDIKLKKDILALDELTNIQRSILKNAALYLKKGGVLVYSTCTINKHENQENVQWLLDQGDFEIDDFKEELPASLKGFVEDNMLQLLPDETSLDGFFIARLIKK